MDNCFEYLEDHKGNDLENCYPYEAKVRRLIPFCTEKCAMPKIPYDSTSDYLSCPLLQKFECIHSTPRYT